MEKLTSPRTIEGLLKKYDLHFNKRFGQNFLIDANMVEKIVAAGQLTKEDIVLEVGPGIGTMTQVLAREAGKVYAVEIDKKLIPVLEETLADCPNVSVICGDILKTDVAALVAQELAQGMSLKIVANLPYYVTTPIIMGFLESDLPVERMSFLIQKEVGERICAQPGTKAYGSLTIACQYYVKPQVAFYVPAGVFMPRPKVDSVVITLEKRQAPSVNPGDKELFFRIVKAAFLNRRKTLINSLCANTGYDKERLTKALEAANIDPGVRAERLTGEDFARLSDCLQKE
ncbi:dimethyladenosine transferase [Eubacterium aggregans]|uniref:Ribosomal RNA small subunit methyltransferase A n=1 Tax=Eubacterium aggregans TaxID=81409 RepID=A0A1H4CWG3_9FIRM|nr:16S rRNA (adenine(1518)-N(6)/adenine(1519)-N(6))-dimethyltransferase RsmA [Eubacterium aggregans]SEA64803.1 dimethyladenosine transferase [Eubacterium aggregans]